MISHQDSKHYDLLQAIHQVQQEFMAGHATTKNIFDSLLFHLLRVTESEYGFIGKVLYSVETNQPYLQTYAITNIAWNEQTRLFYEKNAPEGLRFYNLKTLFGHALVTKEPVISNIPSTDTRRGGLPRGHPPLNSFLGVPILNQDKLTGMFGIANRKDGYNQEIIQFLEPLTSTCSLIIHGIQEREKKQLSQERMQQVLAKQQRLVQNYEKQKQILIKTYGKQKEYAAKLTKSKHRLDAILETIEDVIWSSGLDFPFYINKSAHKLYGYDIADFEKNTNLWYEVIHPEEKPEVSKKLDQLIKNGYAEAEYCIIRKDNQLRYVRTRLWLIKSKDGGIQRMGGSTSDITKITLAERQFWERLETKVRERTLELKQKSIKLQKANENLETSLRYARRLQNAILPDLDEIKKHFAEVFIYYLPRDIVSGDFYWFGKHQNKLFISVIDCTGHGVPGAFMAMMGYALLNEIILKQQITEPDEILDRLSLAVQESLRQKNSNSHEGMDMALCAIDKTQNILQFAGARNPLLYFENGEKYLIKGSRKPVGGYQVTKVYNFEKHEVELKIGQVFYLYSDGYEDQFGGVTENSKGRRFMGKRFRELLAKNHQLPLDNQADILDQTLINWIGTGKRIDDITVLGFKI